MNNNWNIFFGVLIFFGAFLLGGVSYYNQSIDHDTDVYEFVQASKILKSDCEKDLARSKRCVLEYKFVVEKND